MATLFLIPTSLGDDKLEKVIPNYNYQIINETKHFIVENIRTARRFLKKINPHIHIDSLHFYELNKHTSAQEVNTFLEPLKQNFNVGVISESGCPCIADPGAEIVSLAHQMKFTVKPLVGPSSIL